MAKEPKVEKTSKKNEKKKVEKKKTVKKEVNKAPKERYLKSVKKEMALVKWPTWKEVLKNTVATLVLCIIICGFFLLLQLLLSVIKGWI